MNKPKFETPDFTAQNREKLAELFPGVVVEGKVNVDLLRTYIGEEFFKDEAYEFTWVGKREAIAEAGRPIRKTLRPCPEESKNWDTTENLYIEGDNLDVLKLLQESYLGKVKMIYIDPPYNTGNDFIYRDDFAMSRDEYDEEAGVYDDDDNRLFRNTESNGRFHSDWCSMIYPRLVLARNLLRDDGLIFISIDDYEQDNLKKICNEIFGESNFVNKVTWVRTRSGKTVTRQLLVNSEYLYIYAKSQDYDWNQVFQPLAEATVKMYNRDDNDGRGKYRLYPMQKTSSPGPETTYDYIDNNGKVWKCPPKGWRMNKHKVKALENDGRLCLEGSVISEKAYWSERKAEGRIADTLWNDMPENSVASQEVSSLFKGIPLFNNPKPVDYLRRMIKITDSDMKDSVILDFFSGSATTAHAVMKLNAEDGGKRKFIMVQLPEVCAEGTEAAKAGYKNICEIGKERIRRAGEKIKEENKDKPGIENLDIGFRVLKLDSTNMNDVYYAAGDYTQDILLTMEDNIKPDRNDMDLLFGCLLDWGLPLSLPHTHEKIDGFTVHTYNDGDLIACFDEHIPESVVREIASRKPLRAVFRDTSFTSSPEKINVFEIFKLIAPNTSVKVI
ncbi:MAG: Site-specific DNA-methyltransferase (adenine-specific) [Oscillospiraceae bacterium]|jgi:adenine-specific DNA-methyltransferase|nr:Site-specific DNA-methyltransferase (adenine-specific) [Oscillospiraceae bacterium]